MNKQIRKAVLSDAAALMAIKNQLSFTKIDGTSTTGGFLLGTDLSTYELYIEQTHVLVAEQEGRVVGFGIFFNDAWLRKSDLWQRREQVDWQLDMHVLEASTLAYIEQLAFLPGHRKQALLLIYNLVHWAYHLSHEALLTTTVKSPILNLAAVPYIMAAGGQQVGHIDEVYPVIGDICSDIYLLQKKDFYQRLEQHSLHEFFLAHTFVPHD
ncbi:MAG TPA: hypothetical protein PLU10_09225 [Chitinophagaceae bacterium]|nr:hypothetical protein [Chitinophagaceae bacterium]